MSTTTSEAPVGDYPQIVAADQDFLARYIKELLNARRMSQADLARQTDYSESQISRILKGRGEFPSPDKLDAIAEALNVEPVLLHRAYGTSIGLRFDTPEVEGEDDEMSVLRVTPSNLPPEVQAAQQIVLQALIDAYKKLRGEPEE